MDAMLAEMPFKEFLRWRAFDVVDPIGGRRGDWQSAAMCSTLANCFAMLTKSKKRWTPEQFLLEFDAARKEAPKAPDYRPNWQQMKMIAQAWSVALGPGAGKKKNGRR